MKSMQSWLRGHGHLTPAEAARVVRSGRALAHLPATAEAFAAGSITAGQVATIAPVASPEALAAADAQGVDLAAIEASLVAVAEGEAHDQLAQVVHVYRQALDPDGPEPDPTEGRRLTLVRRADGSGTGRFDLDAVGVEKFTGGDRVDRAGHARRVTTAPGRSRTPMRWCSCVTTSSRRARCRRCGRRSRT